MCLLGRNFDEYIQNIPRHIGDLDRLEKVLDSELDKVLDDDPHYACGNCIDDVRSLLTSIRATLVHIKPRLVAYVTAWSLYPEDIVVDDDGNESDENLRARYAYVRAYLDGAGID